jgi:hypothetical protein
LTRRLLTVMVIIAFVLPSMALAASGHKFVAAKAVAGEGNLIVVPLDITNEDNLTAMDIPLQYSEGVTLKEVTFENTRVDYFDLKIAYIDDENRTVVIGLLPQMSSAQKSDLAAGSGTVANLVFQIDDPSVREITVDAVELEKPNHRLQFLYHDNSVEGQTSIRVEYPEFNSTTVSLDNLAKGEGSLPTAFGLNQNYPNPFNPSTNIEFALPVAADVRISVYNVLGQQVATIVNENMDAGEHTVAWDATNYSSGMYFYRISANDFSETKKMVLLK